MFQTLGYMCHIFRDQTAEQILELIQNMVALDHTYYDSFVCWYKLWLKDSGSFYAEGYILDYKKSYVNIFHLISIWKKGQLSC